jgi:hypothetical protein
MLCSSLLTEHVVFDPSRTKNSKQDNMTIKYNLKATVN